MTSAILNRPTAQRFKKGWTVRITGRARCRVPLCRSPDHRRAARGSRRISLVVAFGPQGRHEGDFHRRIESVTSRSVSRRNAGAMSGP